MTILARHTIEEMAYVLVATRKVFSSWQDRVLCLMGLFDEEEIDDCIDCASDIARDAIIAEAELWNRLPPHKGEP